MELALKCPISLDLLPPQDGCYDGTPTLADINRSRGATLQSFEGYDVCAIRSRCQYQKLLHLRRSARARTLGQTVPKDCQAAVSSRKNSKRSCYLHAKAEAMLAKQTARQRRVNTTHNRGLRRKTWRCGKGKGGCELNVDCAFETEACIYHPVLGMYLTQEDADCLGLCLDMAFGVPYLDQPTLSSLIPEQEAVQRHSRTKLPDLPHRQRFQRWCRALEIAEETARNYKTPQYPCRLTAWLQQALQQLCPGDDFDSLRAEFLHSHGRSVLQSLLQKGKLNIRSLLPTPLSTTARRQFLQNYSEGKGGILRPTLHGTNLVNHASIFERGLLIPDPCKNGLRVVHGSAHGLGIYTASLENPSLALGFVRPAWGSKAILLCGVVDDTSYTAEPKSFGGRVCRQQSPDSFFKRFIFL